MDPKVVILIIIILVGIMLAMSNNVININSFTPIKNSPDVLIPDKKMSDIKMSDIKMPDIKLLSNGIVSIPNRQSGPSNGTVLNIKMPDDIQLLSAYNDDTAFEESADFGNQSTEINKFIKSNASLFCDINLQNQVGSEWTRLSAEMHEKLRNEVPNREITGI